MPDENDIQVEVTVPAPEPETEPTPEPETPAVVVVDAGGDSAPDGLLAVLLEMKAEQARQAVIIEDLSSRTWSAEMKADAALANDAYVEAAVEEVRADVEEAAQEEQAPAESDEAPKKSHWLHR